MKLGNVVRAGLVVVAALGIAGTASAQVVEGKFTLPFEARWGSMVLPAGQYTLKVGTMNKTTRPLPCPPSDDVGHDFGQLSGKITPE